MALETSAAPCDLLPSIDQRLEMFRHGYSPGFHLRTGLIDLVIMAVDGRGQKGYYHASSGGDFAIKELFDQTVKTLGIRLKEEVKVRERNPDDTFTILLDPSKTAKDFGWFRILP